MRVVSVVGARPQFVKLAPVSEAMAILGVDHVIVNTGQHYDPALSSVFFDGLSIPPADVDLGVGSGSHGEQTGEMLAKLEAALGELAPDWVLLYGDTNSTLAGAVAAVKMHLPVAHVEAGLRSRNRRMPEEHNRVLTDHAADLLLAPTELAVANLAAEGLGDRTVNTGDVMVDVCLRVRDRVLANPAPRLTEEEYVLATVHRAENTDDPERLDAVIEGLASIDAPVILLAHPRLIQRAKDGGVSLERPGLQVRTPLGYRETVQAVMEAQGVVTDSGGLQKECFILGTPAVTVRTETEWVETLAGGWNILCPELAGIGELAVRPRPEALHTAPFGEGDAATRVVTTLMEWQR